MNYCTATYFLLFLPAAVMTYQLAPQRLRKWILLLSSMAFYINISRKMFVFLLISVMTIYLLGLLLERLQTKRNQIAKALPRPQRKEVKEKYKKKQLRLVLFGTVVLLGILLVRKYSGFALKNVNLLLEILGDERRLTIPHYALPLGISFYTMQAISYLVDVYHETIPADHNPARLLLYLSFFPCVMEGPILRYGDVTAKLWESESTNWRNLTFGAQRILYGLMKKFVVADRLNTMIKTIYDGYNDYDGGIIFLGMVAYTIQLYMEFSGTMDVVIGSGELFGFTIPENFRRPFFSKSISEFWTRWHISLGTWFKDYIFYPVSLSKPMKKLTTAARKSIGNHYGPLIASSVALFAVWFSNGLWHGSAWSYVFFGMYHFFWILLGSLLEPATISLAQKLKLDRTAKPWMCFRILRTIVLVCIGEMFFRAKGLKVGLRMFYIMVSNFTFASYQLKTWENLGIDRADFAIAGIGVLLVLIVSILQERGIRIRQTVAGWPIAARWSCYYALLLFVIIFGAYGMNYIPVDPIYAGF